MKSDFEKLLNNCQSRIKNDSVKVIQISNGAIVNTPATNQEKQTIRPEIQEIVKQKMNSNVEITQDKPKDKGKILFSLKDFLFCILICVTIPSAPKLTLAASNKSPWLASISFTSPVAVMSRNPVI